MLGLDRAISRRPAGVSHQSSRVVPLLRPHTTGRSADKSRPRRKPVQQGCRSCTPFGCRREEANVRDWGWRGGRNFLFKKLLHTTLDYAQERVRSIPLEEALSTPVTRAVGGAARAEVLCLFCLSLGGVFVSVQEDGQAVHSSWTCSLHRCRRCAE